jgi:AcrR family transcriptional regulator
MPYPDGHRDRVRKKIIQSARVLFNRHGFDGASVSQIMSAAGLTHGGFYKYFESKSDLYIEALACFFTDPNWRNAWKGVEIDLNATSIAPQVVRAYLSKQHFDNIDESCPMVALPSDVARGDAKAKRAFETVFRAMVRLLQRDLQHRTFRGPAPAKAIAALCVGGMVVARAMHDRELANDLLNACMVYALKLGGWRNKARRINSQRKS